MGNRAVITCQEGHDLRGEQLGVYVHWNGGYDSISATLLYCEMRGFCSPEDDPYGWARLCQVLCNYHGKEGLSVGLDKLKNLGCENPDNGTFIIKDWKIVGRAYKPRPEQKTHKLLPMLLDIDARQPERQQIGENEIKKMLKENGLKDVDFLPETWEEGKE